MLVIKMHFLISIQDCVYLFMCWWTTSLSISLNSDEYNFLGHLYLVSWVKRYLQSIWMIIKKCVCYYIWMYLFPHGSTRMSSCMLSILKVTQSHIHSGLKQNIKVQFTFEKVKYRMFWPHQWICSLKNSQSDRLLVSDSFLVTMR